MQTSTILASARYAYAHTPADDSSLRAHYLALIIRSRATFKRSGTMQAEMMAGGSALWFDLFVAMVEHLVSLQKPESCEGGVVAIAHADGRLGRCRQCESKTLSEHESCIQLLCVTAFSACMCKLMSRVCAFALL